MKYGDLIVIDPLHDFTPSILNIEVIGNQYFVALKGYRRVSYVKAISHYASEDEIVFRAGSRFKVLNVYQEETRKYGFGKGWVVELEEI